MRRFNKHGLPLLIQKKPGLKLKEVVDPIVRGRQREDKFYKAFQEEGFEFPKFYLGLRRATKEEDMAGTDFFMQTIDGEIPFDVKSSKATAKTHKRHKRHVPGREKIIIFVVKSMMTNYEIRAKAFKEARKWRREFLCECQAKYNEP